MKKGLYKFFDKFSFVDVILIFLIIGLSVFSWSKYKEGLQLTQIVTTQKLFVQSDNEVKSMQNWFRNRVDDLQKIENLYLKSSKHFSKAIQKLNIDRSIKNIYIYSLDGKKIFTLQKDNFKVAHSKLNALKKSTFLGFHQENGVLYAVIAQPIVDKKGKHIASLAIKVNATYIRELFTTRGGYESYLFDANYMLLSRSEKMDTQLVVAFESDKRIDQHIFEHKGYDLKDVIGLYTPVEIYGYKCVVINEIQKDIAFKANNESRNKTLIVLLGAVFFALYMLMFLYKRRVRAQDKQVQENVVQENKTEKEEVVLKEEPIQKEKVVEKQALLWDTKAFKAQFVDMEDMMETIITLFKEDTPQQLAQLQGAVDEKHYKNIKHFAHTIKGSAANLSALEIVKRAQEIENLAVGGATIEEIIEKHNEFIICCHDTIKLMDAFKLTQDENSVEISQEEKRAQLQKIKNDLENSVYVESANFSLLKLSDDVIAELKYAIDSFNTQKALSLIDEILKKEEI